MKIADALGGVTQLGIETSPFIYFVESHSSYIDRMRAIFQLVAQGTPQVVTSVITLTEVLVMPIEKQNLQYLKDYRDMLLDTNHITAHPVTTQIAEQAAQLRAKYRFRTPDALHIATAIVTGCKAFLTNDIRLKRVSEIQMLILEELEI